MPPKVWFIKNMTHEAAGLFSFFSEREKIPHTIVDLYRGERFPAVGPGEVVVILGGPDSANDLTSKIVHEIEALQKCLRSGVPMLGVCLGLQLLVKAAGGTVLRNPVKEIGFRDPCGDWFEIEKTPDGKKDPLLGGVPDVCKIFQLHGETVGLPPSMTCLARGRSCENQVVKIQDRVYGIQGHVELNEAMFESWLVADADLRVCSTEKYREDFAAVRVELERSSETIFKNFLKISGLLE